MSTDQDPSTAESIDSTDAAPAPHTGEAAAAASDDALEHLRDIESKPLAERAPGYQELADRLRTELEHSDPSRGPR